MTTMNAERVTISREIAGIGRLDFEQTDKRRDYWLLPEGAQRRGRLVSVTSILRDTWPKTALMEWYLREGANATTILADAKERGRQVHRFLETYLRDAVILPFSDFEPSYKPWLQAAASFIFEEDPQPAPEGVERLVCHPDLRYAGRPDLIATCRSWPSDLTLFDYKTNPEGNVYAEAHVQTWAYALADFRCGAPAIARRVVVGMSAEGKYRLVPSPDAEEVWGHCLSMHASMQAFLRVLGQGS